MAFDLCTTDRRNSLASTCKEQFEVLVNLGHSAYGASGIAIGDFLLDSYSGGNALDEVHIGLLHTAEKLAGVGTQTLYITPLTLGKQCVESQRRLAATTHARDDHQLVTRDIYGDVLEIMCACTMYMYYIFVQRYNRYVDGLMTSRRKILNCQTINQLSELWVV